MASQKNNPTRQIQKRVFHGHPLPQELLPLHQRGFQPALHSPQQPAFVHCGQKVGLAHAHPKGLGQAIRKLLQTQRTQHSGADVNFDRLARPQPRNHLLQTSGVTSAETKLPRFHVCALRQAQLATLLIQEPQLLLYRA